MPDFWTRFAAPAGAVAPAGLQLLFADPLDLDRDAVELALRNYHPELAAAQVETVRAAGEPRVAQVIGGSGPDAAMLGLLEWGPHAVQLVGFDAPMPYGPVEACVGPAMVAPPLKVDAKQHRSHALLFYTGKHKDAREQFVALGAAAGALARFGAILVLNEEARAAVPATDLIPEPGEDALKTLRELPIPYLWGGFLKLDVGDAARPWVRTFANYRFGRPDFARHLESHAETSQTFRLISALLGYLEETGETFRPGDTLDLGPTDGQLGLRSPAEAEWFLEGQAGNPVLVIEYA